MAKITSDELAVRSSIQIFLAKRNYPKPEAYGSSCILKYKERNFLFTVSHVVDSDELIVFMEANLPADKRGTALKPIGGIITFKEFSIRNKKVDKLENLITKAKPIDIAFAEIKELGILIQPELDFVAFKVEASRKIVLYMDDSVHPRRKETYSFFGRIKPHYRDNPNGPFEYLSLTSTFKHNLKYHRKKGGYYEFLAPEIIDDEGDYEGCSGAPIIDSKGRIVALVCAIFVPSRIIQGMPIQQCKKYLDYALQMNML